MPLTYVPSFLFSNSRNRDDHQINESSTILWLVHVKSLEHGDVICMIFGYFMVISTPVNLPAYANWQEEQLFSAWLLLLHVNRNNFSCCEDWPSIVSLVGLICFASLCGLWAVVFLLYSAYTLIQTRTVIWLTDKIHPRYPK